MKKIIILLAMVALIAGCSGMGGKATIDQAIQYRSGFNTMLSQWNTELAALPPADQKQWAVKAVPVVQGAVLALDTMDVAVGLGGQPTPETVQQYLIAKNKMIDLLAQLVLAKKGGK